MLLCETFRSYKNKSLAVILMKRYYKDIVIFCIGFIVSVIVLQIAKSLLH